MQCMLAFAHALKHLRMSVRTTESPRVCQPESWMCHAEKSTQAKSLRAGLGCVRDWQG